MKRWVGLQGLLVLALFLAGALSVRGASPKPAIPPSETILEPGAVPAPNTRVRFEGPIQSLPAGLFGIWTVGGIPVTVAANTLLSPEHIRPAVGDRAAVRAIYLTGGTIQATYVTITRAADYLPEPVEFCGPIEGALPPDLLGPWTVAGLRVEVTATTTLLPAAVRPQVGDLASVRALRQVDGRLIAQRIAIEKGVPGWVRVEFEGQIQQHPPAAPYTGDWLIANVRLVVTSTLAVAGQPAVGLLAEVQAMSRPDGTIIAERIQILQPNTVSFEGAIQSLPERGPLGTWVVGGQLLTVKASALLDESRAPLRLGQWAVVRATQQNGGPLEAQRIRIERAREDTPPVEFSGVIQSLPAGERLGVWRVGNALVQVAWETAIVGVPTTGRGAFARVSGEQLTDGRIRARQITVTYPWATVVAYRGAIASIPATFYGPWQVRNADDTLAIEVTPWAGIQGAPRPGAVVTGQGILLPSAGGAGTVAEANHILALTCEVQGEAKATHLTGVADSVPPAVFGAWQVGQATVFVGASAELAGAPRAGSQVRVSGVTVQTGSEATGTDLYILAQRIEELGTASR